MKAPTVTHNRVTAADGTSLAYQTCGSGPVVVLANGFCASYPTYRHIYRVFSNGYRVICWDYRGLFGSGPAPDWEAYSLDHQVQDLALILRRERVQSAIFVGWSMGVQVLLEYYRRYPEQFDALIALNGTCRRPYDTVGDHKVAPVVARRLLPLGTRVFDAVSPLFNRVMGVVAGWPELVPAAERVGFIAWLHRIGFMAEPLDLDVARDLMKDYSTLDFGAVARTTRQLIDHDASDVLPTLDVPALVVTATHDWITPSRLSEAMVRAMPRAELAVVKGGTHYAPVEYPEQVGAHIDRFLTSLPVDQLKRNYA